MNHFSINSITHTENLSMVRHTIIDHRNIINVCCKIVIQGK